MGGEGRLVSLVIGAWRAKWKIVWIRVVRACGANVR